MYARPTDQTVKKYDEVRWKSIIDYNKIIRHPLIFLINNFAKLHTFKQFGRMTLGHCNLCTCIDHFHNTAVNSILARWSSQSTLAVEGILFYRLSEPMKKEKSSIRATWRINHEWCYTHGSVYTGRSVWNMALANHGQSQWSGSDYVFGCLFVSESIRPLVLMVVLPLIRPTDLWF